MRGKLNAVRDGRRTAVTRVNLPPKGSLARAGVGRFGAAVIVAGLGLVISAFTARHLGAAGKGTLSTLIFLVALAAPACAFGLGEASQTLIGQGVVAVQRCVSGTLAALVASTTVGMVVFVGLVRALSPGEVGGAQWAVAAAALTLPMIVCVNALTKILDSIREAEFVSGVRILVTATTAATTYWLVYVLDRAMTGALLAAAVGWGCGLTAIAVKLFRRGLRPVPVWDSAFLRLALPIGVPTQLSYLLMVAATRLDLLFVHSLHSPAEAGEYSVALSVGLLVGLAPVALTNSGTPRIAAATPAEAAELAARLCRGTVGLALLSAAVLAAIAPVGLPLLFGDDFEGAVGPALVLVMTGVLAAAQWTACRINAARGASATALVSYAVSLGVMVAGDMVLVSQHGGVGAGVAALLSAAAGVAVAVQWQAGGSLRLRAAMFLPRRSDLAYGVALLRRSLGQDATCGPAGE